MTVSMAGNWVEWHENICISRIKSRLHSGSDPESSYSLHYLEEEMQENHLHIVEVDLLLRVTLVRFKWNQWMKLIKSCHSRWIQKSTQWVHAKVCKCLWSTDIAFGTKPLSSTLPIVTDVLSDSRKLCLFSCLTTNTWLLKWLSLRLLLQ